MKTILIAAVVVLALRLAHAEDAPPGSYRQSCKDFSVTFTQLDATCKRKNASWERTSLHDWNLCAAGADISNNDGSLVCARAAIPAGSWQASCRAPSFANDRLTAQCKNLRQQPVAAGLDRVSACAGDLGNKDGVLTCNTGDAPLPGSYLDSCFNVSRHGNVTTAECKNDSGERRSSTLNTSQCTSQPVNLHGVLRCNTGGDLPVGSYVSTCTDLWRDGRTFHARCTANGKAYDSTVDLGACRGDVSNVQGILSCDRGLAPPPGSYRMTCINVTTTAGQVSATCRTKAGAWPSSTLALADCGKPGFDGSIDNSDGHLVCHSNGGGGGGSGGDGEGDGSGDACGGIAEITVVNEWADEIVVWLFNEQTNQLWDKGHLAPGHQVVIKSEIADNNYYDVIVIDVKWVNDHNKSFCPTSDPSCMVDPDSMGDNGPLWNLATYSPLEQPDIPGCTKGVGVVLPDRTFYQNGAKVAHLQLRHTAKTHQRSTPSRKHKFVVRKP